MRVYKIVLMFIDHDELGPDGAADLIENATLPNHIDPGTVMSIEERDIGEWHDGHALNSLLAREDAFYALFADQEQGADSRQEGTR